MRTASCFTTRTPPSEGCQIEGCQRRLPGDKGVGNLRPASRTDVANGKRFTTGLAAGKVGAKGVEKVVDDLAPRISLDHMGDRLTNGHRNPWVHLGIVDWKERAPTTPAPGATKPMKAVV